MTSEPGEQFADELEPLIERWMRRPEFRTAYWRFVFREPLPLRIDGAAYRRRRQARQRRAGR